MVQYSGVDNEEFRHDYIKQQIAKFGSAGLDLLDIGAGLQPYKSYVVGTGLNYFSHDFQEYVPASNSMTPNDDCGSRNIVGIQNEEWNYPKADIVCDILEIPQSKKYDIILCTEVLEHVPDPVRVFELISKLLKPSGVCIISVPLISLMHQAPYWFQSGLSPFWFDYWADRFDIEVISNEISGDYIDFSVQEFDRFIRAAKLNWRVAKIMKILIHYFGKKIEPSTLQCAGFNTLLTGRKLPLL